MPVPDQQRLSLDVKIDAPTSADPPPPPKTVRGISAGVMNRVSQGCRSHAGDPVREGKNNMSRSNARLNRQTFSTSRELEYFSEAELTTQTGYGKEYWWPGVVTKELVDNSLDACEQAGTPPRIEVDFQGDSLTVADNGPGLQPDVIERILDFRTRTTDKAAYVSPTRGAQGNAFKTVLAIPYVLGGGKEGQVEVESGGFRHFIGVSTDRVLQRPRIYHRQESIVRNGGTLIRVTVDSASSKTIEPDPEFLQNLLWDFCLFNPHATFDLVFHGERTTVKATIEDWRKWLPTDPTSAHWYNHERLETLIGCCIGAERAGERVRTVREFIAEFRGLSATAKQKRVSERAGLERAYLHDLANDGHFDRRRVADLLAAMQEFSTPVKPEMLGLLGREHFAQRLQPVGETLRYICRKAIDPGGLPNLIECAFAVTPDGGPRGLRAGINWSVPLGNPIRDDAFRIDDEHVVSGLMALLASQRINLHSDPVCLAIHLVCPRFRYMDRGKSSISLGGDDE
jgi:DNA topoisomerase VI subunit B